MKDLVSLLKMTQPELKMYLFKLLQSRQMNPVFEDGYLYAAGDLPVLLVAHMDTVITTPNQMICYDEESDMIYSPQGVLGGDDRCGVYAILKLLEKHRPHILFTEDEEIGGIGAIKASNTLPKPDVKYIVEFDRRGKKDCVFYECGNQDFIDYVKTFGFKEDFGTFSDISILGEVWDIASVNLSCGYYNEHTKKEYIIFHELEKTIKRANKMLKRVTKAKSFDHQGRTYEKGYVKKLVYDYYNWGLDDDFYD
jgi:di/tripeptidase